MAFLPRACHAEISTPFAPFFRLLEDMDAHSRVSHRSAALRQIISPKFDVREFPEAYELHGEFPGLDQDNISLEFTDLNTLTVRAHNERHYETATPAVETKTTPAVEEPQATETSEDDASSQKSLKATVQDEEEDGFVVTEKQAAMEAVDQSQKPAAEAAVQPQAEPAQPQQPNYRYHAYERSVGEFYRQFNFPRHIDQEAVTASMKNGILSVIVPKRKIESRKITIS